MSCETKSVIWQVLVLLLNVACTSADPLILKGGTIWPSPTARPIRRGSVLIEGGRITAVGDGQTPKGAQVLSLISAQQETTRGRFAAGLRVAKSPALEFEPRRSDCSAQRGSGAEYPSHFGRHGHGEP